MIWQPHLQVCPDYQLVAFSKINTEPEVSNFRSVPFYVKQFKLIYQPRTQKLCYQGGMIWWTTVLCPQ